MEVNDRSLYISLSKCFLSFVQNRQSVEYGEEVLLCQKILRGRGVLFVNTLGWSHSQLLYITPKSGYFKYMWKHLWLS